MANLNDYKLALNIHEFLKLLSVWSHSEKTPASSNFPQQLRRLTPTSTSTTSSWGRGRDWPFAAPLLGGFCLFWFLPYPLARPSLLLVCPLPSRSPLSSRSQPGSQRGTCTPVLLFNGPWRWAGLAWLRMTQKEPRSRSGRQAGRRAAFSAQLH